MTDKHRALRPKNICNKATVHLIQTASQQSIRSIKQQCNFHQKQDFRAHIKFNGTSHNAAFQDPASDKEWSAPAVFSFK